MFPRIYAIVDRGCLRDSVVLFRHARALLDAGVTLIQYRDKFSPPREILSTARELQRLAAGRARLMMNDRADLCLASGCDGVHLGQDDLSVDAARRVVGTHVLVGVSTHSIQQIQEADQTSADYIALGPVWSTRSKAKPDPIIGLETIQLARPFTRKPLVAIGGISRGNCRDVFAAGADSVAVISDLLEEPAKAAQEFLRIFEDLG